MAPEPPGTSKDFIVGCLRVEEIVDEFAVVNIDFSALDAIGLSPAALKR